MTAVLRQTPEEVRQRLAELGLEQQFLAAAVRRGQLAFVSCTLNHPPNFPGLAAWAETVCALREGVIPSGWRRSNDSNYALSVDPEGSMAIAVATGDDGTGRADANPSTNGRKGPSTLDAIVANQLRFSFMEQAVPVKQATPSAARNGRATWILLIHRAPEEVRCELSLPISLDEEGHVDAWQERILLASIPLDGDLAVVVPVPPTVPDIDVRIRRRA
jgi:hypothetical protein